MKQKYLDHAKVLRDRTEMLHRLRKNIVTCEVGVYRGDFSREMLDIVNGASNATPHNTPRHFMIDSYTWNGGDEVYHSVLEKFKNELNSNLAQIIRADSFEGIASLPDASIDFIYIDSNHSYEITKKELILSHQKIVPYGIIAGHDYSLGAYNSEDKIFRRYGVIEAVAEFVEEFDYYVKWFTDEYTRSFALQRFIVTP